MKLHRSKIERLIEQEFEGVFLDMIFY